MPFSGTTYSVVNSFTPGTTILSSQVNANYTDIGSALTALASGTQYLAKVELGNASDTTLARVSAGRVSIEGGAGSLYLATIDLGNASDTTLSRSAAGQLAVEGGAGSLYVATIELGAASDTTLSRLGAGQVGVEGTALLRANQNLSDVGSASTARTNLGLGTAAVKNTGTSGSNVPLMNTGNTWSDVQFFNGTGTGNTASFNAIQANTATGVVDVTLGIGSVANSRYLRFIATSSEIGSVTTTSGSNVTYNTTSDGRMKPEEHRRPIADSGAIIDALNPIYFRWGNGTEDLGYIAQEAYAVSPLLASPGVGEPGEEHFVPWMMEKGRMEAIHTAELKELRKRLAALEAKIG